ncbi:acyl transferase/acyl hydrolase/lysophospholipase [Mycotypha africana]|uniref:acyl transferase/acyl hydrolase/lysophospholipase n=1 Tax=Mycotypha africana TaxID=64632 RepID=UPI002300B1A6|nr:acyl transferase/acyl hydrolase/lysophospholipase [Mycotypha africana]KAI8969245.1 acyl transferase/acyl hydrolase/lysophospholipase [Mycotypha africana]
MNTISSATKMELSSYYYGFFFNLQELCKKLLLLASTPLSSNTKKTIAYYEEQLKSATSYEEWLKIASMLDEMDGSYAWRENMKSKDYDWELIKTRLDQMREIRRSNKGQSAMIFFLRTSLARNLGDMGNPKLYSHSRVGTKKLISEYIDEVVRQLNWICEDEEQKTEGDAEECSAQNGSNASRGLDLNDKYEFFMNIRQSFGRTALLLSGGGTLGLNHLGVIKSLFDAKLLPRIISGASSGSIMASLICTKTGDELPFDPSIVRLDVFERNDQPDTPLLRLQRLLMSGQLFDIEVFREAIRSNLGDITFQEAFYRTRFVLNITVSSSTLYDMPRLLNYLTAPDVLIWSAVAASCAVPIFYGSSPLFAKDKTGKIIPWNSTEQLYIDGSVENDLPMNRLAELFNVNHFIVCQVNPHVIPFLQKAPAPTKWRQVASFCMRLARTELQHRCTQLTEIGVLPSLFNKIQSIISQKYYGDITIIPEIRYMDFLKVLTNPTPEYVLECIQRGERATWSKMSIIKNHLQIELLIDQMLYRLRLLRLERMKKAPLSQKQNKGRPALEIRSNSLFGISNQHLSEHQLHTFMSQNCIDDDVVDEDKQQQQQYLTNKGRRRKGPQLSQRSSSLQHLKEGVAEFSFTPSGNVIGTRTPCIITGSQSTPMMITLTDPYELNHNDEHIIATTASGVKSNGGSSSSMDKERRHTKRNLLMTKHKK